MSLVKGLMLRGADVLSSETDDVADEQLAAAARRLQVARVDDRERRTLNAVLEHGFDLPAGAADRLGYRADDLGRGTDDVSGLVDMSGHSLDDDARRGLVGMACGLAVSDGQIGEFEDDLVWRVGRLLGFDDAGMADVRSTALA